MMSFLGTAAALALLATGPAIAADKVHEKENGPDGAEHGRKKQGDDNERADGKREGRQDARGPETNLQGDRAKDRGGVARADAIDARREWRGDRGKAIRGDGRVCRDRDDDRRYRARDNERWNEGAGRFALVGACPPGLARKNDGCLPPGRAKNRDAGFGWNYRPSLFGIPLRSPVEYVFYDGYLVPAGGQQAAYIPLLGGALAVGRLWPSGYPSGRLAEWQDEYYGFDDPREYRYVDNVVYRVDPENAAIQSIAALLTGSDFNVGSALPTGYDVYNVPDPYRRQYYDSDEALYRYADGRIYEVDPTTMLITKAIEMVL